MAKRSDELLYTLPETKAASKAAKMKLDALLREAHQSKGFEKRLKEIKTEISDIVQTQGLSGDGVLGVRSGDKCAIIRWQDGRRSLSKELLVENGVSPAQIAASEKQGDGFWMCELPEIGAE